jgi:hypothetical protein
MPYAHHCPLGRGDSLRIFLVCFCFLASQSQLVIRWWRCASSHAILPHAAVWQASGCFDGDRANRDINCPAGTVPCTMSYHKVAFGER